MMSSVSLQHNMTLATILAADDVSSAEAMIEINGLQLDSRQINQGNVFCATPGHHVDGRLFIDDAIAHGAIVVLVEKEGEWENVSYRHGVPVLPVAKLTQKISGIASRFYNNPSTHLSVIGVTGTNGKTTSSQFIAEALSLMNIPCGVIGTLGIGLFGKLQPSANTTPNAIDVQRHLAALTRQGAKAVAMEVSSHGLDQYRVEDVHFHTALFTNLSRDHLDYHGTMQAYGDAKKKLFLHAELQRAVINYDDAFGRELAANMSQQLPSYTYSTVSDQANVFVKNTILDEQGIRATVVTPWGEGELISPLLGRFNLSNLLGVLSVLCAHGYELNQSLDALSQLSPVAGRMQRLGGDDQPMVVVDYAHSPDALHNVLTTLREHCNGTLWCVFGCGGDRDVGKRPLMGEIAESHADTLVITSDNPRFEDSEKIISDILAGIKNKNAIHVEQDREKAITYAITHAAKNDVVLIAGKGHEQYQEIHGQRFAFDDVAHAQQALDQRGTRQ